MALPWEVWNDPNTVRDTTLIFNHKVTEGINMVGKLLVVEDLLELNLVYIL